MTEQDEEFYANGQDAYESGQTLAACPFPNPGRFRDLWLSGWDEARRYAERGRPRVERCVVTQESPWKEIEAARVGCQRLG